MIGLQKKRPAAGDYVVPNNSVLNLQQKPGLYDPTPNAMEKATKCRYCENMAKNFLYLESLIRNNKDNNNDKSPKCSLCNSSLKYLEYVNRNIRQVFGNFDAIVQADRALAAKPAMMPKYSVGPPPSEKIQDSRAKGGAIVSPQKSTKSLKSTKITTSKLKSKEKTAIKSQKSSKSLKSHKSSKSLKSGKSAKSGKSQKSTLKLAKKGLSSKLSRPKSASPKSQISHGKMILKRKFRNKLAGSKVVRSVSQYRSLASNRSKLSKGSSHKKLSKQRSTAAPPTSINWQLLKKNLPKRPTPVK
ncbi:micronuclear linker histone polyprotein [Drosophila takahashii]|uniref:micronuclear linker histone polyprotein n=1 Tax=Drosophila takahashii TaxID=29030 RepID=UPI003898F14A